MAENTAQNAANTPAQQNNAESPNTTAQVFPTNPAQYDPVNGQQAKAAEIVAKSQISSSATPENYQGGLEGSEKIAKNVVDSTRETDAKAAAYNGISPDSDLNDVAPAAGQPMGKSGAPSVDLNGEANLAASGLAAHTLTKPTAGKTEIVHVSSNEVIATKFDPNAADLSMKGKDLVMSFNDGSKIVLEGFAADSQHLPTIALPNGALVAGGIIVAQLQGTNEEIFNLETAAGGVGATGGGFVYSDDFGNVIDLLNKLPPIPFTALTFTQPEPRVFVAQENDPIGGTFIPNFESVKGELRVDGGYEDWQPNQHTDGSIANPNQGNNPNLPDVWPMALNILFIPDDNEVVDQVNIGNIPADVRFFIDMHDGNGFQEMTVTNGSLALTADQFNNGSIYVLPPENSSQDIPMDISLLIRDPDNNETAVISQNVTAVIDAVADKPDIIESKISINSGQAVDGTPDGFTQQGNTASNPNGTGQASAEGNLVNNVTIDMEVDFGDNNQTDGPETHTLTLSGVPDGWELAPNQPISWTDNHDGTYTLTVTSDFDGSISFIIPPVKDINGVNQSWEGTANLTLTAKAVENVTDGEIRTDNNTATTTTNFTVVITDDKPTINLPGAGAPPSVLQESGLNDGSESVTKNIEIDVKSDGPGTVEFTQANESTIEQLGLTSNGHSLNITVSPDGQTITANYQDGGNTITVFTITLGNVPTGDGVKNVPYTFTLFQPLDHHNGQDGNQIDFDVEFKVTDSDNDSVTDTFALGVEDDAPKTESVSAETDETNDIGNVFNGNLNIDRSEDATTVTENNQFNASGSLKNGALTSNGVAVVVTLESGQYVGKAGNVTVFTLDIKADGTYTFTQHAPLDHQNGSDANDVIDLTFGYKVTDFDGDTASSSVTIHVRDDAPVAIADIGNIPDGSNTATGNVITNDTLSKDVVNLLKDASFNGAAKSFATPDGTDAGGKFVLVNGQYGQLKIYENGNYTYTVNANNVGNHTEQFKYTLVDFDGDTSQTTLTLNIVDNGPGQPPAVERTVDETTDINASITGDIDVVNATEYALGNPAGNATFSSNGSQAGGALTSNGVSVIVSLVGGQYVGMAGAVEVFRLSINPATGGYTFVLKAPLDHADGTNPNDIINLNFTYTARDADGDSVSSSITVHVKDDAPLAIADVNSVPDGSVSVNGNVVTNDTLSKDVVNLLKDASFNGAAKSFATPDGTDAGGKFVLVNGQYGQLKIYENGNYTYTVNANNVGNHTEQFKYTLIDEDGDTSQTTLTLNIVDNGPGEPPCVEKTIDETTDINVSITGDIDVVNATQYALGNPAGNATFSSNGSQLGGSLKSDGVPVTVSLVNGVYVGMAGAKEVFTLSINSATGGYTFVLKAPLDHADGTNPNDIINLNFTYTARDADGDAVSSSITIHVKDDAPLAIADTNTVPNGSVSVNGNVVTNDTLSKDVVNLLKNASFGNTTKSFATADGTDAGGKFVLVNGQYGQLKIYENGNYTYTVNANNVGNHTEQFKYTLVDDDGDTSQTTLTLNIIDNGPGDAPCVEQTVDETGGFDTVSDTISVQGATQYVLGNPAGNATFSSSGSQAGGSLKSDGVAVTVSLVNGVYVGKAGNIEVFTLSINNNGTYTFVQKAQLDHADGTNPDDIINLHFTYTAKDADGDSSSSTITIHVKDDAPLAIADTNTVPNGSVSVNGNVVTNDTLSKDVVNLLKNASFGNTTKSFATPDGTDAGGKFVLVNGQYGQLKIYENGNYTYTVNANNNGNHTEQFKYTLVDDDGDTSQTTLTLNIVDNGPGDPPVVSRSIDETFNINEVQSNVITVAGATEFAMGSPNGAATFSSDGSQKGGVLSSNGVPVIVTLVNGVYVGKAGNVEVFTLSIDNTGRYNFVLKAPLDHADGSDPNDIINLNFVYTARDADGDAVSNAIQIHVRDDAPVAIADTNSVPNGSVSVNGNVVTNDTLSKDVVNLLKDASFNGAAKSFATPDGTDAGGKFVLVNGQYGQLKIYENGNYTYTVNANNVGNHTEQFKYTLIDEDGDTSQTTLTLNIVDNGPGEPPCVEKTIDETTDIGVSITDTITVAGATQFAMGAVNGGLGFSSDGSQLGGSLKSNGVPVTVSLVGGQYVGMAGNVEVFRLSINNNGQYTFIQKAPIDHADGSNPNDIINLNFTYTARDSDGDAVESNIIIHVKDDAPIAHADAQTLVDTASVNGNVISGLNGGAGAADTLSKDVTNTLKDVSYSGTTKSFATDGLTDASGKYVLINGHDGQLKIYENGNYTYTLNGGTPQPGNGGSSSDVFNYTLQDKDGDISTTTLTLNTVLPKLIVGENVDDKSGSTTPYEVGNGNGTITGNSASDILVGDVGGSTSQNQQKDYNICLVLDSSGSMSGDKIALLKQAVTNLLNDFNDYHGGSVKVCIIPFSTTAGSAGIYDVSTAAGLQAAIDFVNGLNADGYTNYEAPLQSAISWFNGSTNNDPIAGGTNFTYFVSDGEPNRYMNGNTVTEGSANTVMNQIQNGDGGGTANEVATLQSLSEVVGVGIEVNSTTLARLDIIDSGSDHALDIKDANDLSAALQGANPINQLAGVGGDTITGGDGHDLIFGDALNTDKLAQAENLGTAPGKGWETFAELEANHGWSRADTINYIKTHMEELAAETHTSTGGVRSGGNDTLTGGNGNDFIFGQEGNDVIDGGAGNDVISGGSGSNTLTGGAGADTFLFLHGSTGHDAITDYSNADSDKLDISDLLVGSAYQPGISNVDNYVKIDDATGQVFVDTTGNGTFNSGNQVATINNISSIDTVNVILNDNEGTKIVHTS